ncbi:MULTISPECIES: SDR family NAD(P)-dependent oxidoreductase [Chryseobacterium]|uniref:Decaprenylphospho-beta-D-erythro-pentofuranosid-2-ulose 2-reductase n=1 Tax=Chryseobacterium camelliae TaxID=1265445 RepID=A0ABU0TJ90_9FLAO|nr:MULTISPECIES: SDR family NAD(P)-dependent oxidoreductase [Chryseobacterium]MDT3409013.1 decaprenylphospho-beta-D-erythro-pentofuranosid-2-ulose 2-reductase [Pseudacidovorax intermedius]MDQ1097129.1 decaprenylphospho-beta-D-erythro-pentofuranosid-2-ulose 2-reductase [Chryseobacterium camelliae]MDQ1101066.1 decaprenylphospho-beta-D-erythro-pentofuranosid-2-ulose 2-reductase [Chryseobacterium sp. SORGH_AS_1048]MDR6084509.1 decaprenylphospho-beta-D-erythro-pentofuranosid-2-ulose 2-reductase [Chr
MIVLGSTSEVAQAFVEKALQEGEKFEKIYLLTSSRETTQRFARHIDVKFLQQSEVIELDLMKEIDYNRFDAIHSQLLFCAAGYLGEGSEEGLYDNRNTEKIININYSRLVPVINYFAQKFESRRSGTIIGLSSVAGDRGRQSNFIYGSAKAAFSAYLSGLRNYLFEKKVHVMTVKPGFMATKMTEGMSLNPALTATPKQAAAHIFKAYKNRKNIAYVLPVWAIIMLIIRNIPEFIFKKLKL